MAEEQLEFDSGSSAEDQTIEASVPQSTVNKLIGSAKAEAAEKTRRQVEAEYQQKLEAINSQKQPETARGNGSSEVNIDSIYQKLQERANSDKQAQEEKEVMDYLAQTYKTHLDNGAEKYTDFNQKINGINFSTFPATLVRLGLDNVDNTHEVLYELGNNPNKLSTIEYLASRSPEIASRELKKISDSIKANNQALSKESKYSTNSPLDRMQSSNKAGNDGKTGVSSFKSKPWARG